jgi:gliding motility-associated-like protein
MNLKTTLSTLGTFALTAISFAQTNVFFNNGASIGITDDVDVYVGFDLRNSAGNSFISNAGRLTVKGDLVNDAEITGGSFTNQPIGKDTGVFNLYGNWENNSQFKADESTVKLLGNIQFVKGSSITSFYNLEAQETAGSVKTLQNIDANVTNLFTLKNGVEFATNANTLNITSNNASAIAYDANSFVSSTGAGRLTRATVAVSDYYFPLGSSVTGVATIRPLIVKPTATASAVYAAQFVHNNPTNDGYDVATKAVNVDVVNTLFYHLIKQTSGNALTADLSVLYKASVDGNFNSIGRWQGAPQWEDLFAENSQSASPFDFVTKIGWASTDNQAHALITKKNIKEYEFPSAFTPNGDKKNDRYGMVEGSVATLEGLKIYNRWGELVFDKEKENVATWDGTFLGKQQPAGTYMMYAKIKLLNGDIKNEVRPFNIVY